MDLLAPLRKPIKYIKSVLPKKDQNESQDSFDLPDNISSKNQVSDFDSEEVQNRPASNSYSDEILKKRLLPILGSIIIIIPANRMGDLTEGQQIERDRTINLITASIYFRSFTKDEAEEFQNNLDLKEEEILTDTGQDIYVRLDTKDISNFIEKDSKFSLKKSLTSETKAFSIGKIGLLDKLHGVEKLYRI